ncbi:MAG: lipase family protein [Sulfurimonas sp.]|nr:lipase family protein [Sulfurimonas sp.]
MANILAKSIAEKQDIKALLDKEVPTYRQAYSDRTSWLMACLSELAYIKFNKPLIDKEDSKLVKTVSKLIDENKASSLSKLIDLLAYDNEAEKEKLKSDLDMLNMKIEKLFDTKGTQAMLVSSDKFYVLAFRGTEPTSVADIKSDLNASTMQCESGGKIHTGFNDAFAHVHIEIQECIDSLADEKPLFITGHSLGAALATVATKMLTYQKPGIAGCYTYGSPRVGDEEWMQSIKTPVYRLVNSADPVTMLPFGAETVNSIAWLSQWIPTVGKSIRTFLLSHYSGYYHVGYMRYITNVQDGDYKSAELLYSVNFLRRIRAYLLKKIPLMKISGDHSITVYRRKLKCIAERRN